MTDPVAAAAAWAAQDPDNTTRAELEKLIADAAAGTPAALTALHDRFDTRLEFGTAGLRGAIGAGPNRMNRVLVGQAAAGFAAWLLEQGDAPSVVIGYDGRTNSRVFATDTAEIMAGAGVRAILLPRLLPTPVLAFAVRHLDVSAGVMVTASHNPPADNGYKVYLGDENAGAQIVAPTDAQISAHIHRIADGSPVTGLPRSTEYEIAEENVIDAYVRATAGLAPQPATAVPFVYTAMHGVGWETAKRVFAAAGFGEPHSVADQQEPDAAFPTVAFPNPEEPGALDLAFAAATESGAALIIANDPDADRLGVAIPTDSGWRRLSGNEVGSLLGWRAAVRLRAADADGTLACSLVSSPALREIARVYDLDFVETLTGFKWIARAGGLAFGYEEALGYLVDPWIIRDKDGISAAVDFLALAGELASTGRTVADHLVEFADRFGGYASAQFSVRVTDLAEVPRIMARLRAAPPRAIGAEVVDRIEDFSGGFAQYPPSDILRIRTRGGARVIVRPSGTEPKVKIYIDASSTEGAGLDRTRAAQVVVDDLESGMRALLS
ncbi:MAG: phospho-sugar mutase [Burkholderiaceae bacterium]|nr:phospho-sugar mutase [Microbacteriaceae bacterium]